jgi:ADP-heptose:LPS heptosyltransferase
VKRLAKAVIGTGLRLTKPLARRWARKGYFQPRNWATLEARRIALVACHWLGDTLWAAQTVTVLERRFPDAELFAITKPASLSLWNGWLKPERVLAAPEVISDRRREETRWCALARRAESWRSLDFDLAIDLTGNRYSAFFCYWLRPACSLGFSGDEAGCLYSYRVPDADRSGAPLRERPFRVIEPLLAAWPEPFACPALVRPPKPACEVRELREALKLGEDPYYVVVPGAGWVEKEWPPEAFADVVRRLSSCGIVLVLGTQAQAGLCANVAQGIERSRVVTGEPLGRVLSLLEGTAGAVTNVSGLGHLAAAYGRRTAMVFRDPIERQIGCPVGPDGCARLFAPDTSPASIVEHVRGADAGGIAG